MNVVIVYLLGTLMRGALVFSLVKTLDLALPRAMRLNWQNRWVFALFALLILAPMGVFSSRVAEPFSVEITRDSLPGQLMTGEFDLASLFSFDTEAISTVETTAVETRATTPLISVNIGVYGRMLAAYIAIVLALIGRQAGAGLLWRRRIARLPELDSERFRRLSDTACRGLGVKVGRIKLVAGGDQLEVPASFPGWKRGAIILPDASFKFADPELELVIMHEIAHLRGRDHLWRSAGSAICALFWFNPFLLWLNRRLGLALELEADRRTLFAAESLAESNSRYARLILAFSGAPITPLVGLSMNGRELKQRIQGIFMIKKNPLTVKLAITAALVFAGVISLITPVLAAERANIIAQLPADAAMKVFIDVEQIRNFVENELGIDTVIDIRKLLDKGVIQIGDIDDADREKFIDLLSKTYNGIAGIGFSAPLVAIDSRRGFLMIADGGVELMDIMAMGGKGSAAEQRVELANGTIGFYDRYPNPEVIFFQPSPNQIALMPVGKEGVFFGKEPVEENQLRAAQDKLIPANAAVSIAYGISEKELVAALGAQFAKEENLEIQGHLYVVIDGDKVTLRIRSVVPFGTVSDEVAAKAVAGKMVFVAAARAYVPEFAEVMDQKLEYSFDPETYKTEIDLTLTVDELKLLVDDVKKMIEQQKRGA